MTRLRLNRCVGLRHNMDQLTYDLPPPSNHGHATRQATPAPPGAAVVVPPIPPRAAVSILPPPDPPPRPSLIDFPLGSLAAALLQPPGPSHQYVTWPGHPTPTTVVSVAHVLKRLFPKLDGKIASLASTVESKGESLLTKINSVDTLVGGPLNTLEGRLVTLETKIGSTQPRVEM
jgi:hypothetical protein